MVSTRRLSPTSSIIFSLSRREAVRVITIAPNVKASARDSEADKSAMFIQGREQLSQNMQEDQRGMPGLVQKGTCNTLRRAR